MATFSGPSTDSGAVGYGSLPDSDKSLDSKTYTTAAISTGYDDGHVAWATVTTKSLDSKSPTAATTSPDWATGGFATSGVWSGPTLNRPGIDGSRDPYIGAGTVTVKSYDDRAYISATVGEVWGEGRVGVASWDGPTLDRTGVVAITSHAAVMSETSLLNSERSGAESDTDELWAEGFVQTATFIPAAYFRRVAGKVLDEEGEPIKGGIYVAALGDFPTLGQVNPETSEYSIFLLYQNYEDLILLQKTPGPSPFDFVRYELSENPDLSIDRREVDLKFDTTVPQPLEAGDGTQFGELI